MEHIIQFGVCVDEDKIIKSATDKASNEIVKSISKEIESFKHRYYDGSSKLEDMFRDEIKKVINENKEYIFERAIDKIVSNLMKTKAFKERFENLYE